MIYDKLSDDYLLRLKNLIKDVLENPEKFSEIEVGFFCTVLVEQIANFILMEKMFRDKTNIKEVWKAIEDKPIGFKINQMKKLFVDEQIVNKLIEFNELRKSFIHGFMELDNVELQLITKKLLLITEDIRVIFIDFAEK